MQTSYLLGLSLAVAILGTRFHPAGSQCEVLDFALCCVFGLRVCSRPRGGACISPTAVTSLTSFVWSLCCLPLSIPSPGGGALIVNVSHRCHKATIAAPTSSPLDTTKEPVTMATHSRGSPRALASPCRMDPGVKRNKSGINNREAMPLPEKARPAPKYHPCLPACYPLCPRSRKLHSKFSWKCQIEATRNP